MAYYIAAAAGIFGVAGILFSARGGEDERLDEEAAAEPPPPPPTAPYPPRRWWRVWRRYRDPSAPVPTEDLSAYGRISAFVLSLTWREKVMAGVIGVASVVLAVSLLT